MNLGPGIKMCIRDSKLGAFHHLPHGLANALLLNLVIEFNAAENPRKMGTFSQYQYPHTQARYAECARFVGIQAKDDAEADVYKRQARSRRVRKFRKTA